MYTLTDMKLGDNWILPEAKSWPFIQSLTLASKYHPHSPHYCRSLPALLEEKKRHLALPNAVPIHPLSILSLIWSTVLSVTVLTHLIICPLRLCLHHQPMGAVHPGSLDWAMLILNGLSMVLAVFEMFIGISRYIACEIELDRRVVIKTYLKKWAFFDIMSSLPIGFIMTCTVKQNMRLLLCGYMWSAAKFVRCVDAFRRMKLFLKVLPLSVLLQRLTLHIMRLALVAHWCACLSYFVTTINYYWKGEITNTYNELLKLNNKPLPELSKVRCYVNSLFVFFSTFTGKGFSMFRLRVPDEILVTLLIKVLANGAFIYTLILLLDMRLTAMVSQTRYLQMMKQIDKYVGQEQLAPELRRRLIMFYEYHFRSKYYKENTVVECLSERLRYEVSLASYKNILQNMHMFDNVPKKLVGSILGCLHREVYLPDDLVIRASDVGNSMYFVASGTLAVYTLQGVEICHLEDGAYFGEVALLMKDCKHVTTVVAIEITELYRFDREDFNRFILTNPVLYERIQRLAVQRTNESVLLNEVFRQKR